MGLDKSVRWWDWHAQKQERIVSLSAMVIPGAEEHYLRVGFEPKGKRFAVGSGVGSILLLDAALGTEIGRFAGAGGSAPETVFSSDGKMLAASDGKSVRLWDLDTRRLLRRLPENPSGTQLIAFTSDGKLVLVGQDTSQLWDIRANKIVSRLPFSFGDHTALAFAPDGRLLLRGHSHGEVEIWDYERGKQVRKVGGLAGYVRVATSPDGRLFAAGGWRGIKIWELETGQERCSFTEYEGDTNSLAFSPDGRALATGVGDNNIMVWDIPGKPPTPDRQESDGQRVFAKRWEDLRSMDGTPLVHHAIWGLIRGGAPAVAYLKTVLKPVPNKNLPQLARLLEDLDNDSFAIREKAMKEIEKLGDSAEPALRKLAISTTSTEAKQRAMQLLARLRQPVDSAVLLQAVRAIEALEHLGTPEALALLGDLAAGAPGARVTLEAASSLGRLTKAQMP